MIYMLHNTFKDLHNYLKRNNYKGYEFDDILDSKIVRLLTFNNNFLRRVAIQIGRRSLINFRKMLGVRKLESSKANGYFIKGYLRYWQVTKNKKYLDCAENLLEKLSNNYCDKYSGYSWGNSFDFASRGGFFPKGLPTIVWSSHIQKSFYIADEISSKNTYKNVVKGVARFISENLVEHQDKDGICFSYAPGRTNLVHNSNLLGAVALLRAWNHTGNSRYYDLAESSVKWSLKYMNDDGSWYYGVGEKYKWIDNFHTGYILDCLVEIQNLTGDDLVADDLVDITYSFWINNLFLNDGTPRYYHNKTSPIDIQCCSQAIESLAKYSIRDNNAIYNSFLVAIWTINNMRKKNGSFRFRRGKFWKNNLESIHWGQSTMLSALGNLLYHINRLKNK